MTKFERLCTEYVPPYSVFICVILTAIIFFLRPVVVIVSDDMFTSIYGVKREHYKNIEMSARIFRRIKIINMALDAEPETVAFAVEDAVKNPCFVVFPRRYIQAAALYVQDFPKTKVFLITELNSEPENIQNVQIISTGVELDYYRAGLCAAVLTRLQIKNEDGVKVYDPNKSVLFISENETGSLNESFRVGVRKYSSDVSIVPFEKGVTDLTKTFKCVALLGYETGFLNSNTHTSTKIIAKTWLDPLYAPPNAVVIIDDSPMAILPQLARYRYRKTSTTPLKVVSSFIIRFDRTETLKTLLALRSAVSRRP
jgi:hypothetical protein